MEIQQTPEKHPILGGKAYVYKRGRSSYWQAAAYLRGYNYRTSTKETYLHEAIHYAEEWYFNLRGQANIGVLETPAEKQEKEKEITFRDVAEKFIEERGLVGGAVARRVEDAFAPVFITIWVDINGARDPPKCTGR